MVSLYRLLCISSQGAAFALIVATAACVDDDRCERCVDGEFCEAQPGQPFLQNGNPYPWGVPASSTCVPLPDRCIDDATCACLTCEDADPQTDRAGCIGFSCSDDGAVPTIFIPTE